MKRVKEFTIKLSEGNEAPIVEIDGEKLSGITNLKVEYNSDNVIDNPFDNGFPSGIYQRRKRSVL